MDERCGPAATPRPGVRVARRCRCPEVLVLLERGIPALSFDPVSPECGALSSACVGPGSGRPSGRRGTAAPEAKLMTSSLPLRGFADFL